MFLDATNGALWVEVVFTNFVQLGDGITDNDGDGNILDKLVGQPFEIPGLETIQHPFVVLKHAHGQENVILVGS